MARTKHTMRRRRHRGGGEEESVSAESVPAVPAESVPAVSAESVPAVSAESAPAASAAPEAPSTWDVLSDQFGNLTNQVTGKEEVPATAVGGRRRHKSKRRSCHKGGSHGVGVAAYASPYTQGGGRRRRTRRCHHKK